MQEPRGPMDPSIDVDDVWMEATRMGPASRKRVQDVSSNSSSYACVGASTVCHHIYIYIYKKND